MSLMDKLGFSSKPQPRPMPTKTPTTRPSVWQSLSHKRAFKATEPGKRPMPTSPTQRPNTGTIFNGKEEISRSELRQELRRDEEVFQTERSLGLNLNSTERVKLEKEVFSSSLGRNISKSDVRRGVQKLGNKLQGAKNPEEKEKIRKQIKFFKKIGGL